MYYSIKLMTGTGSMNNILRIVIISIMSCVLPRATFADVFFDTYQHGLAKFKAREYANARADFLRAYDLRPEPIILFNVAQAYRLELNYEEALVYYKRFLAESKIAEDLRQEAQAYVAQLEVEQRVREARKRLDAQAGPKERDGTPVKVMAPPMDRMITMSDPESSSNSANDSSGGETRNAVTWWTTKRKFALAIGTSAVAALTVGTVLGMSATKRQREAYAACPDPQLACDKWHLANDLIRSGHYRAIGANVAFGVGAAAALAASVLWLTGARDADNRASIVPTASLDHVAIIAGGSF